MLVNYWWNAAPKLGSPYAVLLHAALSLRDLPADQRAMWKSMFERLVFSDPEEALGHLPPTKRGLLGPPSARAGDPATQSRRGSHPRIDGAAGRPVSVTIVGAR